MAELVADTAAIVGVRAQVNGRLQPAGRGPLAILLTGASRGQPGRLQVANRGTIVLDERGLLPTPVPSKLLKILEEGHVRRLGAARSQAIDVAIRREGRRRFRESDEHRETAKL